MQIWKFWRIIFEHIIQIAIFFLFAIHLKAVCLCTHSCLQIFYEVHHTRYESIYYTIIIALENIVATGSTSLPSWILLRFQKIIRNTALKYTCKSEHLDILTNYFRRHYTDYNVFLFAIHICNIFESSVSDCSLFIVVIFAIYLKAFLEIIYAKRKSSPPSSCHYYVFYGHDYILHTRK